MYPKPQCRYKTALILSANFLSFIRLWACFKTNTCSSVKILGINYYETISNHSLSNPRVQTGVRGVYTYMSSLTYLNTFSPRPALPPRLRLPVQARRLSQRAH